MRPTVHILFPSSKRTRRFISLRQTQKFVRLARRNPQKIVRRSHAFQRHIARMRRTCELMRFVRPRGGTAWRLLTECFGALCPLNRTINPSMRAAITHRALANLTILSSQSSIHFFRIAIKEGGGLLHECIILALWLSSIRHNIHVTIDLYDPGYTLIQSSHPEALLLNTVQRTRFALFHELLSNINSHATIALTWSDLELSHHATSYAYTLHIDPMHI